MSCFCFLQNPLLTKTRSKAEERSFPTILELSLASSPQDQDEMWSGTWKQVRVENLDNYMKNGVGLNWFVRKLIASTTPTEIIERRGSVVTVTEPRMNRTYSYTFTVGEAFEFPGFDGNGIKTLTRVCPKGEIEWQQTHNFGQQIETRHVDGNEMTCTLTLTRGEKTYEMIRTFRKLPPAVT